MKYRYFKIGFQNDQTTLCIFLFSDAHTTSCSMTGFGVLVSDFGLPGRLAQSGASLTVNQGFAGSSPGPATYFRGDLSRHNLCGHSPLPLIQEGQISVSDESTCTKYWLTA